jgi:hypothetical protein
MAYNFLGLVNDVNRRLNEVELTQANFSGAVGFYASAKDAVNASIREINQVQFEWPFNHVTREETLVPGQVRYSFQANTKTLDMDSFRLKRDDVLGNETQKLRLLSYEEYLDKYLDYEYNTDVGVRTIPRNVFRTPSLEFGVVPSPDKAYTVVYEYYINPASLSAYSDVPTVPEEFRYVIVDGAMVHAHNFRGDNESAELSRRSFQEGIKSLRSIYINRYEYIRSTVKEY